MSEKESTTTRPDGNRWRTLDHNSKLAYVVGFLDGMYLGHCITCWGLPSRQDDPCWTNAVESYSQNRARLVNQNTYQDFVEGLDKLYADERNRKIAINDGMQVVMNLSTDTSEEVKERMLEAWREKTTDVRPAELKPQNWTIN
jgi:hypothetical protein